MPPIPLEKDMKAFHSALAALVIAGVVGVGACSNDGLDPTTAGSKSPEAAISASQNLSTLAATLRVRCEHRNGRSKISVDANNVNPRNGQFKARVRAAGGTVTSGLKRAVGDEVEFDFDSDPGDFAAGATPIPANFIQRRPGADVIGILLNAQGNVVARLGVECTF
jgi:hypothetical protein